MHTETQNTERRLLKYLIDNPQWLTKTHTQIFSDHKLCGLKRQLTEMVKAGKEISWMLLEYKAKTPESKAFIESIKDAPEVDKPLFLELRHELKERAKLRILDQLKDQEIKDPKVYKQILKDLNDLEREEVPKELNKPVNFFEFDKHIAPEEEYKDSGLQPLRNTGSDTKVGDLLNILAASGNFKTGTMTQIAKHQIACQRNVLFFSMEESAQSFISRVGGGILRKTPYQYRRLTPADLAQEFKDKKFGQLDVVSGEIIYIEDLEQTILDMESERGYKYDFIIIDYSAQIEVKSSNKNDRSDEKISKIFRGLKMIAMNHSKIFVTAIQSNREGYGKKKTPDVDNTAGSMGGVHAADLVIAQKYRTNPEAIVRNTPEEEQPTDIKGFVKLTVRKKRTGTIKVDDSFYFSHSADGNMHYEDRESTDMANLEQWDNLFSLED